MLLRPQHLGEKMIGLGIGLFSIILILATKLIFQALGIKIHWGFYILIFYFWYGLTIYIVYLQGKNHE